MESSSHLLVALVYKCRFVRLRNESSGSGSETCVLMSLCCMCPHTPAFENHGSSAHFPTQMRRLTLWLVTEQPRGCAAVKGLCARTPAPPIRSPAALPGRLVHSGASRFSVACSPLVFCHSFTEISSAASGCQLRLWDTKISLCKANP